MEQIFTITLSVYLRFRKFLEYFKNLSRRLLNSYETRKEGTCFMDKLKGKKLLILGATYSEISLVQRAQKHGVIVYVTDNHTDYTLSPAKNYADYAWDVSWSDIEKLYVLCKENHIDGVTAGYSEIRVECLIRLCEKLGLPCYITMDQLEVTRDKTRFKNECKANGIPVIKEFSSPQDVDVFPVIVKPVDRAGSIGISIAHNYEELIKSYNYAMEMSLTKQVIIEEYITNAVKFDVYYEIIDGVIKMISSDDVINAANNDGKKVVQSGWILPSIHQEQYKRKADTNIRKMIQNLGIKNGYMFFSGFADKNSNFAFFECGFRLCGGYLFNYFPDMGFHNQLDIFIYHALTGSSKGAEQGKLIDKDMKCVTINLYSKTGTISTIEGWEEIQNMEDCRFTLQYAHLGQKCDEKQAILSKIGMAYFCNTSFEKLAKDVEEMYKYISVKGENGEDLIFDRVNPEYIVSWEKGEILNGL